MIEFGECHNFPLPVHFCEAWSTTLAVPVAHFTQFAHLVACPLESRKAHAKQARLAGERRMDALCVQGRVVTNSPLHEAQLEQGGQR